MKTSTRAEEQWKPAGPFLSKTGSELAPTSPCVCPLKLYRCIFRTPAAMKSLVYKYNQKRKESVDGTTMMMTLDF